MINEIRYRGVLIPEAAVEGERSCDGMMPNYAQGMQGARDRWLVLFDTVDCHGRDCWRTIFYQIREGAPDGRVITEEVLVPMDPIDVLPDGTELLRSNGQPSVFGVPKGALINGAVPDHANVFAVTSFGCVVERKDGELQRVNQRPGLDSAVIEPYHEIMHVRLNDAEDDIEIISPRRRMQPADGSVVHGHGWAQPIPDNAEHTVWLDSFSGRGDEADRVISHRVGAIRHTWNPGAREYEWTATGPIVEVKEGLRVSETNLVKLGEADYALAVRSFNQGGHTYWYRTSDPFAAWGEWIETPDTVGQRYAFLCGDGVLRVFLNRQDITPYGDRRNPLYTFDVAPDGFVYSNRRVVMDARELGLPLSVPFLDHVHLYEPIGDRQIMSVRTITCAQVWRQDDSANPSPQEMEAAGIHYVEIVYDKPCKPRWQFAV